jgi:K+-sensing histidine kinase KdpD
VGNLFAATPSKRFRSSEIALLRAFGQQAAAGIRNARLYRKAEERRHAAQMFGKIAFSAATAVHTLRNHIGSFQMYLELLRRLPPARRDEMLANISQIESVLRQSVEILDTLWEPWHQVSDEVVDVNDCLRQALDRSIPGEARDLITVKLDLSSEDLYIRAASDIEKGEDGEFRVQSRLAGVKRIEVSIEDNGIGIPSENVSKIFDIGWTTKRTGMGFGLYWTKDFIEGLGGRIEVESVLQEGTTFRIRLPRLIES